MSKIKGENLNKSYCWKICIKEIYINFMLNYTMVVTENNTDIKFLIFDNPTIIVLLNFEDICFLIYPTLTILFIGKEKNIYLYVIKRILVMLTYHLTIF